MNSRDEVRKLYLQGVEIDLPFPVAVKGDIVSLNVVLKKEFEIIKQTLCQLEKKNKELKKELKRCQYTIKKWMDNHSKLIIDNGKMKKALDILRTYVAVSKRRNEVNGNYDISCIYSFGSYKDITQGNYELLKEVLCNDK